MKRGTLGVLKPTRAQRVYDDRVAGADWFERLARSGALPTEPGTVVLRSSPTTVWLLPGPKVAN